jgi:hypothetical protein
VSQSRVSEQKLPSCVDAMAAVIWCKRDPPLISVSGVPQCAYSHR